MSNLTFDIPEMDTPKAAIAELESIIDTIDTLIEDEERVIGFDHYYGTVENPTETMCGTYACLAGHHVAMKHANVAWEDIIKNYNLRVEWANACSWLNRNLNEATRSAISLHIDHPLFVTTGDNQTEYPLNDEYSRTEVIKELKRRRKLAKGYITNLKEELDAA